MPILATELKRETAYLHEILRPIWIILTLGTLWVILCRHLSSEWSINEQYNYGWFVPFLALYLVWLRWEDRPLRSAPRKSIVTSIAIGWAALVLLLPLRIFEIGNPDWRPLGWIHAAAVTALTLLYIWCVGGTPWLRHFAFPIAFIFVAVPWVSPIEQPIVQGLMRTVASVAAETLSLFGIPAQLEGSLIRVSTGIVGVNEACSGVRSLQTSLMIGLLFGELKRLPAVRRLLLVLGALAVALVANFLRAFVLVWVAANSGIEAVSHWHDVAGYSIVAVVFLGSIAIAALLGRGTRKGENEKLRSRKKAEPNECNFSFNLPTSYFVIILSWLLLVEAGAELWYRAHERNLVTRAGWTVRWPKNAPDFREVKINEGVRATLRYDEGRQATWKSEISADSKMLSPVTRAAGARCTMFFFRWEPRSSSVLRARAHRPEICLPNTGWRQISDRGSASYFVRGNLALPFRHVTFAQDHSPLVAHSFFCLQEDKLHPSEIRPDWSFRGRARVALHGVRNLGQQVLEIVIISAQRTDAVDAETHFAKLLREVVVLQPQERPAPMKLGQD
jgi:exosortase